MFWKKLNKRCWRECGRREIEDKQREEAAKERCKNIGPELKL